MTTSATVASFVGGRFRELPATDATQVDPVFDPATGQTIALLPYSTSDEIDEAVRAARDAFPAWANTPVPERAQVMFRFKQALEDHFDELALLVTRENGKTLPESRGEVRRAIEVVELACAAPTLMMGHNLEQIAQGIDEDLVPFPFCLVGCVPPFGFSDL